MKSALTGTISSREKLNNVMRRINMEPKVFNALFSRMSNQHGLMMLPVLLHPKSRGYVRLASTDILEQPLINPGYLRDHEDVDMLVEAIRLVQKFMGTKVFQSIGAAPTGKTHPYCHDNAYDSDEYWACFIKHNTMTLFDPVGTCKMGPVTDPTTVVDTKLRVHGIKGLRVVDASIMPRITSGNVNAPTRMIAEKAVDLILGDKRKTAPQSFKRPADEL